MVTDLNQDLKKINKKIPLYLVISPKYNKFEYESLCDKGIVPVPLRH